MSIYIYCPRKSEGAFELVKALDAQRLRRFDGLNFWDKKARFHPAKGDVIVCWGASVPEMEGLRVLNSMNEPMNKYEELKNLAEHGVPTLTSYLDLPIELMNDRSRFIARHDDHQGGRDLLSGMIRGDYWVRREDFSFEYRIHMFSGRSIKAGVKVPREGFVPVSEEDWVPNSNMLHPWIRSYDGGWRINYVGFRSTDLMKKLALRAVKAFGLTFGAIDLASNPDGVLKVLEVNRAPGIEGSTIDAYVKAINKWIAGEEVE